MKHKIEVIDYLRGLAIIAIIFLHIIAPIQIIKGVDYSTVPLFRFLTNILEFCVVTIVICSGFSLYSNADTENLAGFYKKRLKRLLEPWIIFCFLYLIVYSFIGHFTRIKVQGIPFQFPNSFGLLFKWDFGAWFIVLILSLTALFPLLKYIYNKKKGLIILLGILYIIGIIITYVTGVSVPTNLSYEQTYSYNEPIIWYAAFVITLISGWSLVYLLGFYLKELYNKRKLIHKELAFTFGFIALYVIISIIYKWFGLNQNISLNKFPPTPIYLAFGIAVTFVIITIFYTYKNFIHSHLKKIFQFFSDNSFWAFFWSLLVLSIFSYWFSFIKLNIYIVLILEFMASTIATLILIKIQKYLVRHEMMLEKHHF